MSLRRRLNTVRELGPGPAFLGPLLYQPTQDSPTGFRRITTLLNQALFERGMTPPWIWSRDRCQRYWASRTSDGADNRPADYVGKDVAIVDLMHDFWSPEVFPGSSVLELGCNAGANLERLRQLGYTRLAGIEVNPNAIKALRDAFPAVAREASITEGKIEEVLPSLDADSVDVVYTMAVLLHLHPASDDAFDHVVRVARRNVCVIEAEATTLTYIFARNYRRVFERRGWREVRALPIAAERFPTLAPTYTGYVARLFAPPGS